MKNLSEICENMPQDVADVVRAGASPSLTYPGGVHIEWPCWEKRIGNELHALLDQSALFGKGSICCYISGRFYDYPPSLRPAHAIDIKFQIWVIDEHLLQPHFARDVAQPGSSMLLDSDIIPSFLPLLQLIKQIDRLPQCNGSYSWQDYFEEQLMVSLLKAMHLSFSDTNLPIYCSHHLETDDETIRRLGCLKKPE